jgi:hypothetical protein
MRAAETPWLPAGLLLGAGYWVFHAASAGGEAWVQYAQLFDQSRLTHATSLDFMLCSLLMPFWMGNDAERRGWERRCVECVLGGHVRCRPAESEGTRRLTPLAARSLLAALQEHAGAAAVSAAAGGACPVPGAAAKDVRCCREQLTHSALLGLVACNERVHSWLVGPLLATNQALARQLGLSPRA